MADVRKVAGTGDGECGERGERGKRGHRGHRGEAGATGATGATGSTGATGATGSVQVTHVEATNAAVVPLPGPLVQTTVVTCPSITAPIGTIVQFTGIVGYDNAGNTDAFADPSVSLLQDGSLVVDFATTTGAKPDGNKFDMDAILPLSWSLPGDGLPHVYSLAIETDLTSDGTQTAVNASLFINVFP